VACARVWGFPKKTVTLALALLPRRFVPVRVMSPEPLRFSGEIDVTTGVAAAGKREVETELGILAWCRHLDGIMGSRFH
jgi:hypothetical protein